MRSFTFRAWDSLTKEMLDDEMPGRIFEIMLNEKLGVYKKGTYRDHPFAFMQSTGFKDADGTEIFEGDILSFTYGIPPVKVHAPVVFRNGRFDVLTPSHDPDSCPLHELEDAIGEYYIDGHVYDNNSSMFHEIDDCIRSITQVMGVPSYLTGNSHGIS